MKSLSSPFIKRPVATTLLCIGIALAGAMAYRMLPVSPLPQVDFPAISVSAALPGASPETMASSVATPLERQFGRIAGIVEMTSTSYLGSTQVTLLFDLNRNIDAAARDVQAAINAAVGNLPSNLPSNPTYRKVNPADPPVVILSITSEVYERAQMFDAAASVLQQKLAQVPGVGQVFVGGSALPAVRVDVNPTLLNAFGLGLSDVRNTLAAANANRPKGQFADDRRSYILNATDQLFTAKEYRPLLIAFKNGAAVRIADVAEVSDSVEDIRTGGLRDGKPAILLVIFRQPGANIIDTVDRVIGLVPELQAEIPAAMHIAVAMERTSTIRASISDVQRTMLMSIGLVTLVVFVFLRSLRGTFIPFVAVPISLIGTFGVMYLAGYNIDNLSLMALTVATGFVVDDAIVVIENITRHIENGMSPMQASLRGAGEIGFTVVSMSVSLVAVFIPILLMSGYVGRLFREFAVTLSVAIIISMFVSLTMTPMMCARLLKATSEARPNRLQRSSEAVFNWVLGGYRSSLAWVLRHPAPMLVITVLTMGFTVYLYIILPKGFFPPQDTGRITGQLKADMNVSFQSMSRLLGQFAAVVSKDKAVDNVLAFTGGGRGTSNVATMFVSLKPLKQRDGASADQVITRLRKATAGMAGAALGLQRVEDVRGAGGRPGGAQYQYTLQGDNLQDLNEWVPKVMARLKTLKTITDLDIDQQNKGLEASLVYDRATASRMGISTQAIDDVLYDAFGQRQVSTMFTPLNQYHVVMEVAPQFTQNPDGLKYIYARNFAGQPVPLSAFSQYAPSATPLQVNHTGQFPSVTISFNTPLGVALGQATDDIQAAARDLRLPVTIHGSFSGTAAAFQAAQSGQLLLVAAALITVYIVLGMLYESLMHPITILSTLPSAGVGALLALLMFHTDLTVIAMIGIILLIGIVKKNGIMMVDFALVAERRDNKTPKDAIFQACLLRFRPIIMTTLAAMLGGLPLALGRGVGSELRRPLGITIVGGLLFSQVLTLYTTPVIYLYLDWLRLWFQRVLGIEESSKKFEAIPAV